MLKRGFVFLSVFILLVVFLSGVANAGIAERYYLLKPDEVSSFTIVDLADFSENEIEGIKNVAEIYASQGMIEYSLDSKIFSVRNSLQGRPLGLRISKKYGLSVEDRIHTSFIVEFKSLSVSEKSRQLNEEIENLKKIRPEALQLGSSSSEIVDDLITQKEKEKENVEEDQRRKLERERRDNLNRINSLLGTDTNQSVAGNVLLSMFLSFTKRITGYAVNEGLGNGKIKNQFYYSFNGISIENISIEDAERIKTLDFVEGVYPNLEVQATLMDSVHHINGDSMWGIDYNGNDCSQSKYH
jgi:hypothetical protein